MTETIEYTNTTFSMIVFFDEEDNELMQISGTFSANTSDNTCGMRVPNIGERVFLASYEGDRVNDKKSLFKNSYKVVDVISHYSENKKWKNISVQYSVILRKED